MLTQRSKRMISLFQRFGVLLVVALFLTMGLAQADDSLEKPGRIKVFKYEDLNVNGQHDEGEPGMGGWDFTLYDADDNELATMNTGPSGWETFLDLEAGSYTVCEVAQDGWASSGSECQDAEIATSNERVIVEFGNYKLGKIKVLKYEDLNTNGQQDEGEPVMSGWDFTLYDDDDNELATQNTGPNGMETFVDLEAGSYTVCEAEKDGWTSMCKDAEINESNQRITLEFGNYKLGKIKVLKYEDLNINGQQDEDEPVMSGWDFTLYDDDGNELATQNTGPNGMETFVDLEAGSYTVCEAEQDGWTSLCKDAEINESNQRITLEFGNYKLGKIKVLKYNDANANGELDEDEVGMGGWDFTLYDDEGNELATQNTGPNGMETFVDLEAGSYTVCEVEQDGWTNTDPGGDACEDAEITESNQRVTLEFGNTADAD